MRRRAALFALSLLLAGCAVFKPEPEIGAAAVAPTGPAAYELRIEAPDALRELLERFLDLSRYRRSADTEGLTEIELARLVAAAPAQVRALLRTEGYFEPGVRAERQGRDITLVVEPGPRTTVDRVTIETQGPMQEAIQAGDRRATRLLERARQDWSLKPGEPFRQDEWSAAKNRLLARLRGSGYASATYSGTSAQVDPATLKARLLAIADSGPLYRLGELRIEGLKHHGPESVRNQTEFKLGDVATERRLLDFQERLQTAGLFEGVSVSIEPDPESAESTPVLVRVRESPLQQATTGVGVSANTGPRVSLEHLHRRPFGWAARSKNKLEIGRDRRAWEGELSTHVLPGLYRNLVSGSIERLATADEVRSTWSARVGRTQDTRRIDRLYFAEVQSSEVTTALGSQRGDAVSVNYHGVWRDVDNVLLPTRGRVFAGESGLGYARSNFADSGPFTRLLGRLLYYRPIGGQWYLQSRLELGQVFAADRVGLPDTLLFRAGGDDSVRGYAYRTLGPVVDGVVTSGRVLGTGSVELARPITPKLPELWGAVFLDGGNAADAWHDLKPAYGVGAGVRVRSPIGALRVDLAYGEQIRKFRLHFSIGVAL
jgi:translocation and assembly module TamA